MTPRGRARAIQGPPRENALSSAHPIDLDHTPQTPIRSSPTRPPRAIPLTPPTNPKTAETQDILTAKHETEKSNHETITASHEMVMANHEMEKIRIATKIIEA